MTANLFRDLAVRAAVRSGGARGATVDELIAICGLPENEVRAALYRFYAFGGLLPAGQHRLLAGGVIGQLWVARDQIVN